MRYILDKLAWTAALVLWLIGLATPSPAVAVLYIFGGFFAAGAIEVLTALLVPPKS